MTFRFWPVLLFPLLFACTPQKPTEIPITHWEIDLPGEGVERWTVSGDTIFINQGGLFESRGYLEWLDDTALAYTGLGVYRFPMEWWTKTSLELKPEPGTGDGLSLVKDADPLVFDPLGAVSVPIKLPASQNVDTFYNIKHLIALGPGDGRLRNADYAMQIGPWFHTARDEDIADYLDLEVRNHEEPIFMQDTLALLIDQSLTMDQAEVLLQALQRCDWVHVIFATEGTGPDGVVIGHLVQLGPDATELIEEEAQDVEVSDTAITMYHFHLAFPHVFLERDTAGSIILNDQPIEPDSLKTKLQDIYPTLGMKKLLPIVFVGWTENETWGNYVNLISVVIASKTKTNQSPTTIHQPLRVLPWVRSLRD